MPRSLVNSTTERSMGNIQTETRSSVEQGLKFHQFSGETCTYWGLQRPRSGCFTSDLVKLTTSSPTGGIPVVEQVLLFGAGQARAGGGGVLLEPGEGVGGGLADGSGGEAGREGGA